MLGERFIDEIDIGDFVALAKKPEPKPKEKVPRTYPAIGGDPSSVTELRLDSIGPVVGIDALNPRNPLTFGEGSLSVVYGSNGSGKSGYTRIISKACGKPHSIDLKPNVYESPPQQQECTFGYSVGTDKRSEVWVANSDPLEDLKAVDVFDTECGRLYLEEDSELSYEPPELALFSSLVDICEQVKAALTAEQAKLASNLPDLPDQHAKTPAGQAYAALLRGITPTKLAELVTWTPENEKTLQEQRERVKVADPIGTAKKKRQQKGQIDELRANLQRGVNALGEKALDAIGRLKDAAAIKRNAAKEGAAALGGAARVEGVGSATWKAMWEAARTYSTADAYPDRDFPHVVDDARCLLCHQDLDEAARERLTGFEEFVKGTLEKEAAAAEGQLSESLKSLPTRPSAEELGTACQAAGLSDEVQAALDAAWAKLEPTLAPLRKGTLPESTPQAGDAIATLLTGLEKLSADAERTAADYEKDAKSSDRKEALQQVADLEGKKWVAEQAKAIRAEVERLKKWAEFDEWKRKTTTTGISRKAGELSQVLVTDAYVERFNCELQTLGANRIRVELVKTDTAYGRTKHGIRLREATDDKVAVSTILSEGERRVVALAAFIADVTGAGKRAPFIFDDPISSLDQTFEEKVIARLVELSEERQVLIFTHRLSFLVMMNDLAGKGLHDVHIRREPAGTGQPGEVPLYGRKPDKALNDLRGRRVTKARKVLEDEGFDDYYPLAKSICSDFRILIERFVEYVLLDEVVLRFRRSVQTMGRIESLAKINSDDCQLIDKMMTKYSCFEHSQSEETPVDVPEPDDLEMDIQNVLAWHEDFKKRAA